MLGADYIATGHYVQRTGEGINCKLVKGLDGNKDQSYFLHAVGALEVSQTLFPIGAMEKPEVRMIAEAHGLANHAKKTVPAFVLLVSVDLKIFARLLACPPWQNRNRGR